MRKAPSFDSQFEAADALVSTLRADAAACAAFIEDFARKGAQSDDEAILAQRDRFQAFATARLGFDGLLGEMVAGLDRMTAEVSADMDSFRGLTARERLTGWFSRQRMWRLHRQRVHEAPVIERLLDLLSKSNAITGLVSGHREFALACHKAAESDVVTIVEQRGRLVGAIDIARLRMKEMKAKALTRQGRIGLYGGRAEWERMEEERRALEAEAEKIAEEELKMRDESQRREGFITMFQEFVDALNSQIGLCNALLRKLSIGTEERLIIYQAQVDTDVPGSKAKITQQRYPHIAGPISLFERGMLVPQDIGLRKAAADAAFGKKFAAFAESHDATDAPIIDLTQRSSRFRLRFARF
ncbi:hypothetical protein [Rhizobium sullae]|uniref:hypothetical protein n=1 Tax=Rhizobium sullae TaxID=50338 RepID=UPI000B357126|nr:hypothetical protein [Rhizobium sullae]